MKMISYVRRRPGLLRFISRAAVIGFVLSLYVSAKPKKEKDVPYYPFPYLCPKITGGLGNSMFVYATVYALAAHTERDLLLPSDILAGVFENVVGSVNEELCSKDNIAFLKAKKNCAYDPDLLNIPEERNFLVGNYLQSYKYFEKYQSEIRTIFTIKQELKDLANEFLNEISQEYRKSLKTNISQEITFVSIHVRRGDMLQSKFYNAYGYNIPNEKYIQKAIEFMKRRYSNVVFIFASNDMKWVKSQFKGQDIFYSKFKNANQDFALLSSVNHSITTVGTYGWWSAYLAGGTTLYYKYPAREGSELRGEFSEDYTDFFLPEWIGLD